MNTLLERPMSDVAAHIAALPLNAVVEQLQVALGEYLTMIVGDAEDTPSLRAWVNDTAPPANEGRLRFALEVVRRLSADHGNGEIHAWFSTVHPDFGEMPARVIGKRPLAQVREPMLQELRTEKEAMHGHN